MVTSPKAKIAETGAQDKQAHAMGEEACVAIKKTKIAQVTAESVKRIGRQ